MNRCRLIVIALLLSPVWTQAQQSVPLEESVHVELVQLEVSVWPKKSDDEAVCRGLTTDDFHVKVSGRDRKVHAVDWLGSAQAMQTVEGQPAAEATRPALSMVILFDLWHLDLFYQNYVCPITKPMAFDQARRMIREEFQDGDRMLLATLSGWAQIHEGWLTDREQALEAIDRLEVSPFVVSARRGHSNHENWFAGLESLMLALGRYPGRKEVFYMADDFRFDDLSLRVFELAARAQANQVTMHAPDLLASCRTAPGPGSRPSCPPVGGLGCTDFRYPIALGYLTVNTGGEKPHSEDLVEVVRHVRELSGCRYLISFEARPRERKRAPKSTVHLTRKDLALSYPSSFGHPAREPTEREEQDALFLLPRFGEGLTAEVVLWPLRPHAEKKKSWRGLVVGRVGRATGEAWPAGLTRLNVELVVNKESKILGNYAVAIEGEELEALRAGTSTRLLVFQVERIRPGWISVAMRVKGVGGAVSANVRSMVGVTEPPGPGESAAWFLAGSMARVGEAMTLLPALDGTLARGRPALFVGYGCRGEAGFGTGQLRGPKDTATIVVPFEWLDAEANETDAGVECGWIAGTVNQALAPGLWRFEPPAMQVSVDFRVVN